MAACHDLRVEYLTAPIGIGVTVPRFTWLVDHAQAAYQLEVAAGGDQVWATGAVASPETALIDYAGAPLRSNSTYTWRVRSRAAGSAWTAWASSSFETALLDAADWQAAWVEPAQQDAVVERWSILDWIRGATPVGPPEQRLRPPQLVRQRFTLEAEPVRARLYATARGVYSAFVNGRRADDQVLAPGSDAYRHRISVQCYDVTGALTAGENVLGVALADGWWAGRLGLTGSSAQFGTRTSAIWQLHLDFADGTTSIVASGADARSARGRGPMPICSSASCSTAAPSPPAGTAPDSTTPGGCRWQRWAATTRRCVPSPASRSGAYASCRRCRSPRRPTARSSTSGR
ncbi:alpha-L-rhamnosidase N-terminal domain-containing protein [Microbacterium elymi]|uniref:Alpha-L-rhamnosidase N-terminal domain-containing protein n=1 Tax=Microbacterium elymi TaxID=2909587 RepID=A0ABY5NLT6_9MICO|nr:alpha-L-rhamnosidase N-terminal domain-containing protein [Microbacterium elymi]UUT36148.1 alpha-L-rhamnosidase N-terminal domain-containing protein [Microbacterium elymi]